MNLLEIKWNAGSDTQWVKLLFLSSLWAVNITISMQINKYIHFTSVPYKVLGLINLYTLYPAILLLGFSLTNYSGM